MSVRHFDWEKEFMSGTTKGNSIHNWGKDITSSVVWQQASIGEGASLIRRAKGDREDERKWYLAFCLYHFLEHGITLSRFENFMVFAHKTIYQNKGYISQKSAAYLWQINSTYDTFQIYLHDIE